ncbi:MAG TPA: YccF domain-containing protein [Rhodanobacteraceae bacterium]
MSLLRLIGNLLWLVLGGLWMGLAWWLVGVVCFVSIVGIPWGRACFVIGGFTFWPFGREAVSRRALSSREDVGTGPLGAIGNLIWLVLGHIACAVADFVTIIGIPFGIQHVKLALVSLWPIGTRVVQSDARFGRFA